MRRLLAVLVPLAVMPLPVQAGAFYLQEQSPLGVGRAPITLPNVARVSAVVGAETAALSCQRQLVQLERLRAFLTRLS